MDILSQLTLPFAQPLNIRVNALIVVLVILTVPLEVSVLPVSRPFRVDNPHIMYPISREHVPVTLLAVYSIFLPLVGILMSQFSNGGFRQLTAVSLSGFLLSSTLTMFVVDCLKLLIGNHRPDFIQRCMPKEGLVKGTPYYPKEVCTNPNWGVVLEGCKSTPSGHSALSFAGLMFLSLVLKRNFGERYPKPVYFTPLLLAVYIALSRIVDHRHHWIDVISGSIIGSVIALSVWTLLERQNNAPTNDVAEQA